MTLFFNSFALFSLTAFLEIVGCYGVWMVIKSGASPLWLLPSLLALLTFAWLLTFSQTTSGRTFAAYGGVYVIAAYFWHHFVDKAALTLYDIAGLLIILLGTSLIIAQPSLQQKI